MPTFRAASTSGARRSRRSSSAPDHAVVGQARHPTPTEGGPTAIVAAIADTRARRRPESAGVAVEELGGVGVGSPGAVDQEAGTVASARNLPELGGARSRSPPRSRQALGAPSRVDNDVQVAVLGEFELGAGQAVLLVPRASGGGPGSAAASSSTASSGSAAAPPARSATSSSSAAGPAARAGGAAASRPTPAAARWRRAPGELDERGHKTDLFDLMEKRGRDAADERRLGRARSTATTDMADGAHRPRGRRARRRRRARRSTCSTSRPSSSAAGSAPGSASRTSRGSPRRCSRTSSSTSRPPAVRPGGARRPRRRDRRALIARCGSSPRRLVGREPLERLAGGDLLGRLLRGARARCPTTSPSIVAAQVKLRSCGGPSTVDDRVGDGEAAPRELLLELGLVVDVALERVVDALARRRRTIGRADRARSRARGRARRGRPRRAPRGRCGCAPAARPRAGVDAPASSREAARRARGACPTIAQLCRETTCARIFASCPSAYSGKRS